MAETPENRLKRLAMRSSRRGIKEMDLILGAFARGNLDRLTEAELDLYECLLEENDHDLFAWVNGQAKVPDRYAGIVADVAAGAKGLTRPAR